MRWVKKTFKNKLSLAAVFLAAAFFSFRLAVSADSLTRVSDTLSSSQPGAAAGHTIRFRVHRAVPAGGKIEIDLGANFAIPSSFHENDADFLTSGDGVNFTARDISASVSKNSQVVNYNESTPSLSPLPFSSLSADFNNDGFEDFAVAHLFPNNLLSIRLNNGNGGFLPSATYPTASNPYSLAKADFNGDGFVDLAAANFSLANSVSVFLNQGDGTFAGRLDYPVETNPNSVAVGNFNSDVFPDLAVLNNGSNSFSILMNNGDGTFAAGVRYSTAYNSPRALASADIDRDGLDDVVVVYSDFDGLSVYLNSTGVFGIGQWYNSGGSPYFAAAADFNGDGYDDIATANRTGNSVSIFLNNQDGTLGAKVDYAVGSNPYFVLAKDTDGNGSKDLVAANYVDNSISVLSNNGGGVFGGRTDFSMAGMNNPASAMAADFNNDSRMDFASANRNSSNASVWFFDQSYYEYNTTPNAASDGLNVRSGDINKITFTLNSSAGIAANDYVMLKLGRQAAAGATDILNPGANGSYKLNIKTYDVAAFLLERAEPMVALVSQVSLSGGIPIVVANGKPGGILAAGTISTILSVTTNFNAFCRYSLASNTPFSSMTDIMFSGSQSGGIFHSSHLTDLAGGQFHYYFVRCSTDNTEANAMQSDYLIHFYIDSNEPGQGGTGGGTGGGSGTATGTGSGTGTATGTASSTGDGGGTGGGTGNGIGAGPGGSSNSGSGGNSGGGGGNNAGGEAGGSAPEVEINGWSYPVSTVSIAKDGKLEKEIRVDDRHRFSHLLSNLSQGVYTLSVWSFDSDSRKSNTHATTFWLKRGTKTVVSDIIIPPTIDIKKSSVEVGAPLEVFGQSVASSVMEVWLFPDRDGGVKEAEIKKQFFNSAKDSGLWSATLDTKNMAPGNYRVKARSNFSPIGSSDFSISLGCGIGAAGGLTPCQRSDLNKDKKVNLVDFSIMMFHWNTNHAIADINQDGKVNLVDFSMMLFCWTG